MSALEDRVRLYAELAVEGAARPETLASIDAAEVRRAGRAAQAATCDEARAGLRGRDELTLLSRELLALGLWPEGYQVDARVYDGRPHVVLTAVTSRGTWRGTARTALGAAAVVLHQARAETRP